MTVWERSLVGDGHLPHGSSMSVAGSVTDEDVPD